MSPLKGREADGHQMNGNVPAQQKSLIIKYKGILKALKMAVEQKQLTGTASLSQKLLTPCSAGKWLLDGKTHNLLYSVDNEVQEMQHNLSSA